MGEILDGEKCGPYVEEWTPFGGATSFSEYDNYIEAQEQRYKTEDMAHVFRMLVDNIWANETMNLAQKARAVQALTKELAIRVENVDTMSLTKSVEKDGNPVMRWFKRLTQVENAEPDTGKYSAGFTIFRDKSGSERWLGIATNQYEDREKEILEERAHIEYADWVERTKEYPVLRLWHVKGLDIGTTDFVDYHDGFLVASGLLNADIPETTKQVLSESGLGMSIGFRYKSEWIQGGIYSKYRAHEISVLPIEYAANPLTQFTMEKPNMNQTRKAWLERAIGPDKLKDFLESLSAVKTSARNDGIAFKDVSEILEDVTDADTSGTNSAPSNPSNHATNADESAASGEAKTLIDVLTQMNESIKSINQRIDKLESGEKETAKGLDDKLAALLTPKASITDAAKNSAVYGDTKTVVDDDDVDKTKVAMIANAKAAQTSVPSWAENYEAWGLDKLMALSGKAGK